MKYKQELSRQLALDYCCNAEEIFWITRITLMYMSKGTVDADLKNRMIAF